VLRTYYYFADEDPKALGGFHFGIAGPSHQIHDNELRRGVFTYTRNSAPANRQLVPFTDTNLADAYLSAATKVSLKLFFIGD
jgi:hypothetical protein